MLILARETLYGRQLVEDSFKSFVNKTKIQNLNFLTSCVYRKPQFKNVIKTFLVD